MISKTEGALQELEETMYWFELLVDSGIVKAELLSDLMKEADERTAILVSLRSSAGSCREDCEKEWASRCDVGLVHRVGDEV